MAGTFRVPHRIYSEPDQFGYRRLIHAAGSRIPWAAAVALGLAEGDAVPAEEVPFVVPHNVYEETPEGRRLVRRAGTMTNLAEAVRLGLVAPPADVGPVAVPPAGDTPAGADTEALVTPQVGKRVRTAKVPDPGT